ncbi:MAG: hypothetical protein JNJ83_02340 [Verrucomicrobiaceae bacterium]|nr:hypothetical protein [Verrucomicrobiaceae bacterium]
MNSSQLQALLIDDHLGELSPEVSALLTAYLEHNPRARQDAEHIQTTLGIMRQTLHTYPELAQLDPDSPTLVRPRNRLSRIAAVAALVLFTSLGVSHWITSSAQKSQKPALAASPGFKSPWTRYRLAADPKGNGLNVTPIPQ